MTTLRLRLAPAILAFCLSLAPAFIAPTALAQPVNASQAGAYPVPNPPDIKARNYLLVDVSAGMQILAAKDPKAEIEPASLTKLMTAYIVFEALREKRISLDQSFTVSPRAQAMEGSRMFIEAGTQVPVEDLLKGLIVQSGNDAATVLAEGVGGSVDYFVQMMNHKAKQLGMTGTQYQNPEGLTTDGHYTTAYDLSILARRLLQDFPEYVGYYAIKKYRYPGTPVSNDTNRNTLLFRDPSVDGLKTGHTNKAGYCLVATAKREYPELGARRLIAIVLGTNSDQERAAETQKLLNWGYSAYQPVKLFAQGQAVTEVPVWKGKGNSLKLGHKQDIVVAVPTGSLAQIGTHISRKDPLLAPIRQGQSVAKLHITIAGRNYRTIDLKALDDIPEAGIVGRGWDSLRLWIR